MKRVLGLIICSGILFALSGCNASASTSAAQPKGGSIAVTTRTPNNAKASSNTAATSPLPTVSANASADSVAMNSTAATSPLPTESAATPPSPAKNGQPPMALGVMGTVISVDGSTITVQDSQQQSNVTVLLTDNTQVFKQVTIALTDVSVGESLSAMGSLNGDVFTAAQIRLGVDAAPTNGSGGMPQPDGAGQPGGNPPDSRQPPAGGQPPSGGQPPAGNQAPANGQAQPGGRPLSGTVTAVSSDTLTIETASGSTMQVRLDTNGQIVRQVAGTSADITPNVQIMVRGEQSDTTITATRIDIVPAVAQ